MSKTSYPTKYQITKLEKRVDEELDPIINLAELELKAVLADEVEVAMTYLAKKIKADKVINNLQKAVEQLEVVDDVLWLNYKGYEIRIEKSKSHNNNNLVITVHPDTESDYTHRLEVENQQASEQKG